MNRLREERERKLARLAELVHSRHDCEARCAHAVVGEHLLRLRLVERDRESQRVASAVRHAVELADRGHVRLAIHSVLSFGDVEDDVRSRAAQFLGKAFVRFKADDFAESRESVRHSIDGFDAVPLGEFVAYWGRLFFETGRFPVGRWNLRGFSGARVFWFQVVGETDSSHSLPKKMRARDS